MWKESRRQLILRGPAGDYAVLLSSCSLPRWGQIAGQSDQGDRRLAAKQQPAVTRSEAIRGMIDAMLHILAKDPGGKPAKKAKIR